MKILAINFGHDASLALFEGQKLTSFLELERVTRLKHTVGVSRSDVVGFLQANSLRWQDLEFVALVGTQWYKAKHSGDIVIEEFDAEFSVLKDHGVKTEIDTEVGGTDKWYDYAHHQARLGEVIQTEFPLDAVSEGVCDLGKFSIDQAGIDSYKTVYPYSVEIDGIKLPAAFVPHQIAHAAYGAFYRSPEKEKAIILSHDGGWPHIPFNSGGIFLYQNGTICPVLDPRMFLGQLYQIMGERAGFRPSEAPGKLMGLASYGIPEPTGLTKLSLVLENLAEKCAEISAEQFHVEFAQLCVLIEVEASNVYVRKGAKQYEFSFENVRTSIGIAAYTQKLVENMWAGKMSVLLESIADCYEVSDSVAVVGGFSLNCPSNSLLQSTLTSLKVKPLPGGSDMGVSIGAGALLVSYLTGRFPCNDQENPISPAFPPRPDIFTRELPQSLTPIELDDPLGFYAAQLAEGKIFCHVEGESEVGPRALGHRSIIAHAANGTVRDRINRCKGREMWRPLAPIVRASDVSKFFEGPDAGEMSRFMLSTYRVVNPEQLPAVTHVDHTARTQMVEDGTISDVLDRLSEISEIPVIVNTSFNVAGEPLVETYTEAVSSFEYLGFDYLYIDGKVYQSS